MSNEASPGLIERARREPSAFGELFDLYIDRVYAFCLGYTGSRSDAERAAGLTFERARTLLPQARADGSRLSTWLLQIAASLVPRPSADVKAAMPVDLHGTHWGFGRRRSDDLRRSVYRWQRANDIRSSIATLPSDQRRILKLHFWDEMSVPEIARSLDRTEVATEQLLQRALDSLSEELYGELRVQAQ